MELAEHLFTEMSTEEQRDCLINAMRLCYQIRNGYGLGEPYYIVIDNDALSALKNPNIYPTRYVALMLLFRIVKQKQCFRILINPAIFYEFNGRHPPHSEPEFQETLDRLTRIIAQTGVPPYTTGLNTFRQAKKAIKSIEHDLKKIGAELAKIKSGDWKIDFQQGQMVLPLSLIARENCPNVNMKYFSSFQAKRFLQSVIESKIFHHKKNKPFVREFLRDEAAINKSKMLENKKGKMKGLGDLSILSLCDMTAQFRNDDNSTLVGVTFDERLEAILSDHSSIIVHSDRINLGQETSESISRKLSDHYEKGRKLDAANEAANNFPREFFDSLQEIEWLKGALPS